ncbi:CheR family methyltransferase [Spongorhabdus nitratireducens]
MGTTGREADEIKVLLEAVYLRHGFDYRNYAMASLRRRVHKVLDESGIKQIIDLVPAIWNDDKVASDFLRVMSIPVTEMFRDPPFFIELREKVLPILETYPFIKIWHAGCATGEEVLSMAILLREAGLEKRVRIYATDYNDQVLKAAKEGIYSMDKIPLFESNYQDAQGKGKLSDYYHARYDQAKFDPELLSNVTFANHNLVTDGVFGEMNLILCRNVLIYFNKELQQRVFRLITDSLCPRGILGLGNGESLRFSPLARHYEHIDASLRLYRKKL